MQKDGMRWKTEIKTEDKKQSNRFYKMCSIGEQLEKRLNSVECASLNVEVPAESNTHQENVYVKGTCLDQVSRFELSQWARRSSRRLVHIDTYVLGGERVSGM